MKFLVVFFLFFPKAYSEQEPLTPEYLSQAIVLVSIPEAIGTGSVISPYKILTAFHMVEGFDTVQVSFYKGDEVQVQEARVVVIDQGADQAILKLEQAISPPYLKIKDFNSNFTTNTPIITIGHPNSILSLDRGEIFDLKHDNTRSHKSIDAQVYALNIHMPTSPGASGSPVLFEGTNDLIGMLISSNPLTGVTTATSSEHLKILELSDQFLEKNHEDYGKNIIEIKTFNLVQRNLLERGSPPVLTDTGREFGLKGQIDLAYPFFKEASKSGYIRAKAELLFYFDQQGSEAKSLRKEILKKADFQVLEDVAYVFYQLGYKKLSLQFMKKSSSLGATTSQIKELVFYQKGLGGGFHFLKQRALLQEILKKTF